MIEYYRKRMLNAPCVCLAGDFSFLCMTEIHQIGNRVALNCPVTISFLNHTYKRTEGPFFLTYEVLNTNSQMLWKCSLFSFNG